jgi:hypothetical protein
LGKISCIFALGPLRPKKAQPGRIDNELNACPSPTRHDLEAASPRPGRRRFRGLTAFWGEEHRPPGEGYRRAGEEHFAASPHRGRSQGALLLYAVNCTHAIRDKMQLFERSPHRRNRTHSDSQIRTSLFVSHRLSAAQQASCPTRLSMLEFPRVSLLPVVGPYTSTPTILQSLLGRLMCRPADDCGTESPEAEGAGLCPQAVRKAAHQAAVSRAQSRTLAVCYV